MSESNRIIIIGGGIAGLSAAQSARETSKDAVIKLISGEERLPYYRPRICEIFSGLEPEKLIVKNAQWFTDNNIDFINGTAKAVDYLNKSVEMNDGSKYDFDKLIIATGAVGNLPPAPGSDADNVLAMRFIADVDHVRRYPGAAVIIGGGLLGLEAAWHLSKEGRAVTVVDRGAYLLSRQLDMEASTFFKEICQKAGVNVVLNGNLDHIGNGEVVFEGGITLEAKVVLFAAGIKPVVELGQALGLKVNRAIDVDEKMQTSLPDVYACGDCAEISGINQGLWTVSLAQGKVAGINAAGGNDIYKPEAPSYSMNAMGTKIWSLGDITASDGASESSDSNFKKLFFNSDGKLVGAILIGDISKATALKKAISSNMNKEDALLI